MFGASGAVPVFTFGRWWTVLSAGWLHAGLLHVAMNTLEKSLDPEMFQRIHRSVIVNVRRIKELQPALHGEYVITLENGVRLQSGRTSEGRRPKSS